MAIGRSISQAELNNATGAIVSSLFATMDNIGKVKAVLDTLSVANLEALGFSTTDANQLKSAFTDLEKLRTIFVGTGTQTPAYDFRTFAKSALGTGLY
jgi:hypothetical protein